MKKKITVIVADDHPVARVSIMNTLSAQADLAVVGQAEQPSALLVLLERRSCDVLVTDLSLSPDGLEIDGLAMLQVVRRRFPLIPVVVSSMYDDAALVRAVFALGVMGFVSKRDVGEDLIHGIRAAVRWQRYLAPGARASFEAARQCARAASHPLQLTEREAHVLGRYLEGDSIAGIASGLGRSLKTISAQRGSAMRKLWVSNDADLFALAGFDGIGQRRRGTFGHFTSGTE